MLTCMASRVKEMILNYLTLVQNFFLNWHLAAEIIGKLGEEKVEEIIRKPRRTNWEIYNWASKKA